MITLVCTWIYSQIRASNLRAAYWSYDFHTYGHECLDGHKLWLDVMIGCDFHKAWSWESHVVLNSWALLVRLPGETHLPVLASQNLGLNKLLIMARQDATLENFVSYPPAPIKSPLEQRLRHHQVFWLYLLTSAWPRSHVLQSPTIWMIVAFKNRCLPPPKIASRFEQFATRDDGLSLKTQSTHVIAGQSTTKMRRWLASQRVWSLSCPHLSTSASSSSDS